jgi:kynureninase
MRAMSKPPNTPAIRRSDFAATRAQFQLPEGIIYLDGNSLGPLPKAATARVAQVMSREWGHELIGAWNTAGWMTQPARVGDRIGRLIGAAPGTVMMGDTLSIKVYQALAAALELKPERRVILSDSGNFPSDLYMAQGLIGSLNRGHELRLVAPADVEAGLTAEVAVLLLTESDYRTGRRHDMARLTAKARACGVATVWDLAHSAGAFPVAVGAAGADFAVGCSYKFLNGGPGAPAFIYVAPQHQDQVRPALSGWLGHEQPFAFDTGYRPGVGIERMRVGTPPVLAMAALETALDIFEQVDMVEVYAQAITLGDQFIADVARLAPQLRLVSPRDGRQRGSQVSFAHPDGYAAIRALIARGVIGDFRAPDIMRFGICPLFTTTDDMRAAAAAIGSVMADDEWNRPEFQRKQAVT